MTPTIHACMRGRITPTTDTRMIGRSEPYIAPAIPCCMDCRIDPTTSTRMVRRIDPCMASTSAPSHDGHSDMRMDTAMH